MGRENQCLPSIYHPFTQQPGTLSRPPKAHLLTQLGCGIPTTAPPGFDISL